MEDHRSRLSADRRLGNGLFPVSIGASAPACRDSSQELGQPEPGVHDPNVPTLNPRAPSNVSINTTQPGGLMSFLKRLFGKSDEPRTRVRVCVECGMPVAEHKTWCSIRRGELEMKARTEAQAPGA